MTAFAAIADDLTGACDVAAELAAAGHRVRVVVQPGEAHEGDGGSLAVVNTQSRALSAAEAAARVREALGGLRAPVVLKKIDTALRGHLGAELDAACDVSGAPAFVIAAIPAAGRVTRDGCQWFGGTPLAATEFARDPEGPGAVSSIPDVLARESARHAVVVGRDVVRDGSFAAEFARRRGEGADVFVLDAESDEDVRAAVAAILALPGPVCLAGSIALASALAAHFGGRDGAVKSDPTSLPTPALIVSGSLHSRARAQIEMVLAGVAAVRLALPGGAERAHFVAEAVRALSAGTNVVVAAAAPLGVPSAAALRATERALAEAVAAVVEATAVPTLVSIGGETSHAILVRIGAGAIEVHGRIAPLVASGTILHGPAAGTRLVTKGGSGGEPDVIASALATAPRERLAKEAR